MIDAKRLQKYLYLADMAVGCDICGKDTWTCTLPDDEIFVEHRWHHATCPLQGRADVYSDWGGRLDPAVVPWSGKVVLSVMFDRGKRIHTLWLETHDSKRYRIVPISEIGLYDADPCLLEGNDVHIVGSLVNNETIYYSMMMQRFKHE